MKKLFLFVLLAVAGGLYWAWLRRDAVRQVQEAPVRYTQSLHNDMKKAAEARDGANAAIQQRVQEAQRTVQEAVPE